MLTMPQGNLYKSDLLFKSTHHAFVEGTLVKIRSKWNEIMPAGKMWAVLKDGILESG